MANKDRSFLAVKQKRQDVTNYQPLSEGQGQVLVLAEAETLTHPFVERLVPVDCSSDRADGFVFFSHIHSLASSSLRSPTHLLLLVARRGQGACSIPWPLPNTNIPRTPS